MKLKNKESLRKLFKQIYKGRQLYLLLALPLIYLIIFSYVPMAGVQIAFKDYTFKGGIWGSKWVGLKHFTKFLSDYQFIPILMNTLRVSVYTLTVTTFLPIFLALALNCLNNVRLKKTIQTLTYLPHFISVVVLIGMLTQMLNPIIGIYGNLVRNITGERARDLLGVATAFPHLYVWSGVWQNTGFNSIIYIAALAGSDQDLHEAAQIDGATRLQRVRYIDIPCIIPTAVILLILNAGKVMSVGFEKVYLLQNSLNLTHSEVISTYVYKQAFGAGSNFSYSTAIGLFNSVINLILIVTVNKISKKVSDSSLW